MKKIRLINILLTCIIGLFYSSCDTWFDFTSEDWDLEPQYISSESISFGESSNSQTLYISNNGGHSQISFSITPSEKWIVPATTSGTINKGEDMSIIINVNRTYLPEGNHSGNLTIYTDDSKWDVPVSAIGINKIEGYPTYINFGSNDDVLSFKLRSLSGTRDIELIPSSDWISVSEKDFSLSEYDATNKENEKTVSVTCKRSLLTEGEYTTSLEGYSGLGAILFSIPISVTIPSQNGLTIAIDNYIFTLSKHLYWEGENVVMELGIKNHKYLKAFELIGSESYALADNNIKYSIRNTTLNLQPNAEGTMKIYIENVDKSVKSFGDIKLSFRDLSENLQFSNIELQ